MSASSYLLPLTGLDALDPLGHLAALGCLLATTEYCRRVGKSAPRMHYELGARLLPSLEGPFADIDDLVSALVDDLEDCAGRPDGERDPFLAFSYDDAKGKSVHDLKPPPAVLREYALGLLRQPGASQRRALDWFAATLTDVAKDGSDNAKPFALHFTAGQQRFLTVALGLLDGAEPKSKPGSPKRPVDGEDLRAAIVGPWPEDRALKVFSWSPRQDRAYALRALDPSGDQKLGTPGADWLALRGIGLMSSAPVGTRIQTGGVRGGWKSATYSYPVWSTPMDADAVRSLLRHPAIADAKALGEGGGNVWQTCPQGVEVLTCQISRSDQGGYGAFSRPHRG